MSLKKFKDLNKFNNLQNKEALEQNINPFDHGTLHTEMWKTDGLKKALDLYNYDIATAGARRDEELSRAKKEF